MDKNMIHIDDFVRARLAGGEENERPGAWMAMRELLDKEMPEVVAAPFNWRRLSGVLLLLLVGTSLTVVGYKTLSLNAIRSTNTNAVATATATYSKASFADRYAEVERQMNLAPTDNVKGAGSNEAGTSTAQQSGDDNTEAYASTTNVATRHHVSSSRVMAGLSGKASTNTNSQSQSSTPSTTSDNNNTLPANNSGNDNSGRQGSVAVNATTDPEHTPLNSRTKASGVASIAPVKTRHNGKANVSPSTVAQNATEPGLTGNVSAGASGGEVATKGGLRTLVHTDSIEYIEMVQRRIGNGKAASYRLDTINMDKVAVFRPEPMQPVREKTEVTGNETAKADKPARNRSRRETVRNLNQTNDKNLSAAANTPSVASAAAPVVPAAAMAAPPEAKASDGNPMVPLSNSLVSSKHHNWWNPEKFDNMVRKFQYKASNIQVYTGIDAGINGSVSGISSLGGFQCGLTALVAINEMLSLNTGLNYYLRLNTGTTVHDSYTGVDPNSVHYYLNYINGVSYNHYSWEEKDVDHHFNFDKVQTFELPIQLRYSMGRFFAEGGLNLVYAMKMKATEITIKNDNGTLQQANYPTNYVNPANGSNVPTFGSQPVVNMNDFGSRFGTGIILGGGYHFSPAVTLNLHISKNVWDNARTEGARKISNDVYKLPSIQLSVGYRFSQQKAEQ